VYGYICLGVAFILLILLLCCCSRIRLAVAVCKVAGRYVIRVCLIILVPIFQTLLLIALWAACLVVMIYLVSLAEFHIAENSDVFTTIKDYADPNLLRFYYFVFATLWVGALLGAIEIFVIASSCAMWYYNNGAEEELDSPILRSYKMAFRYHFGSLAFGAFILAVVRFLMFLVEVFKKQAEASGADQNQCFEYLVNCLQCCLACIERIVQFLNKTAYIQIAIRGKNFCSAAKDGFETVWSNGARYLIVAGIGEIMMFFGKLFIAAGTTACFYALITFVPTIKENIVEPLYLLIVTNII
jgi:choline transporter-like protein 2/4/5